MPPRRPALMSWPFQTMWVTKAIPPPAWLCCRVSSPVPVHLFSSLSSSAASLAARVQRSTRSVRCQGLRSRSPTPWKAPLTDRSPSLALTPASAWLSTWSMPGKMSRAGHHPELRCGGDASNSDPAFFQVYSFIQTCNIYLLLSVTAGFALLRLSSEATGLAANWRRGSSSAPIVPTTITITTTQHPHFLSRGPLLNLMQKQRTRNSPFSPRLCFKNLLGHRRGIGILFIYWF